jgi:hypothetical protein
VVLESFTKTKQGLPTGSPCLVLVKDSRTTDLWLGLLIISDQNYKLKTTMNIPNILVGRAAKAVFSVQGVKLETGRDP